MSERDRQNPYERSQQHGGGNRGNDGTGSPGQANQWQQGDNYRQQGGDWQQDGGQRGGGDDYRFSGQGSGQNSGQNSDRQNFAPQNFDRGRSHESFGSSGGSSSGSYRSQLSDDDLRRDQRDASRNYESGRGGGYGQRGGTAGYAGRDFDASGGNDFGSFTSEDFGGRDFSNRGGGGATGGLRSSESYRPSYGVGSWFGGDDDDRSARGDSARGNEARGRNQGHEEYGSWRQYGESRGFLQRAGDEVASWFGDEDASRRREQDHRENQGPGLGRSQGLSQSQSHRGRGPSGYTRSDERIREDANDHLTHDHHVDASHITVSVKDGELTLDGTVENRDAKRRAEDVVEHVSGVKHVQNNLRIQERNASASAFGTSGGSGASFSQSSGSGLTGSSAGSSSTPGTTGSSSTGSSSGGSSSVGSSSGSLGQTGANTTSGIGSTATAGVGSASTTRASDKTS